MLLHCCCCKVLQQDQPQQAPMPMRGADPMLPLPAGHRDLLRQHWPNGAHCTARQPAVLHQGVRATAGLLANEACRDVVGQWIRRAQWAPVGAVTQCSSNSNSLRSPSCICIWCCFGHNSSSPGAVRTSASFKLTRLVQGSHYALLRKGSCQTTAAVQERQGPTRGQPGSQPDGDELCTA